MSRLRLIAACSALCLSLPALAELRVDWPPGWQVEAQPAPSSPFEQGVSGERVRAVKLREDGEQAAVAELTSLPLPREVEVKPDEVLAQMRQGIQFGFARSRLMTRCEPPADTRLGALAAREVACVVSQNGAPVLRQHLLLALGEASVYSLTYALREDHATEVDAAMRGLLQDLQLR